MRKLSSRCQHRSYWLESTSSWPLAIARLGVGSAYSNVDMKVLESKAVARILMHVVKMNNMHGSSMKALLESEESMRCLVLRKGLVLKGV